MFKNENVSFWRKVVDIISPPPLAVLPVCELHNTVTVSQQQVALVLMHRTRGRKEEGRWGRERDFKSGSCQHVVALWKRDGDINTLSPEWLTQPLMLFVEFRWRLVQFFRICRCNFSHFLVTNCSLGWAIRAFKCRGNEQRGEVCEWKHGLDEQQDERTEQTRYYSRPHC